MDGLFSPEMLRRHAEMAMLAEPAPSEAAEERSSTFRRIGLPAWAIGTGLDLAGTYAGLGREGTREANPIYAGMGRGKLVAVNGLLSALMALAADRIAKTSPERDRAMTLIGVGSGAARGALGVRNFRQGR